MKRTDWVLAILALAGLAGVWGHAGETVVTGAVGAQLDALLSQAADKGFSGVCLAAKSGEVVLSKGYGLAHRKKEIPITPYTVFDIGSITKQFTAAAILALEMEEKLSVEDPITKYFEGVPEDKQSITLHHLLTHSSGLRDSFGGDYAPMSREAIVKKSMKSRLLWKPGEAYRYSNAGYSLLGAVIEKVSGGSYEACLRTRLFEPAGMEMTGYRFPAWKPGQLAHGYRGSRDTGTPLDHRWDGDGPFWNLRANGGILSTVSDMYRWYIALQGDAILTAEAKKKLFTPHVREGDDAKTYYGYGWVWVKTRRDTTLICHNGGNGIFFADFRNYIDEEVLVIFMTNNDNRRSVQLLRSIAAAPFPSS